MGEAKRRGTFEERRDQAIAAGRVKFRRVSPTSGVIAPGDVLALAMEMARRRLRGRWFRGER
jgi:hypothetical protein